MATRPGANRNEPVDTLVDRLLRMTDVDDVVKYDAAIGMRRLDDLLRCAQRGDDDRHFLALADFDVVRQAVVGGMADLVHGKRRRLLAGLLLPLCKLGLDADDP